MTKKDAAFCAHIRKLQRLALRCPDQDRRHDAIRSLACMVMLIGGFDGDGKRGEIISWADYIASNLERAA